MADGTQNKDEFEAAFAQFASPGEATEAAAAPEVEAEAEPTAETEAGPTVEAEVEVEAEAEPIAETEAGPVVEAEPDAATQLVEQLKKLIPEKTDAAPAAEVEVEAEAAPTSVYNDEEREFLSNYEKEWPEVHRAEALRRKAEYHDLLQYVFTEIAQKFNPIAQTVENLAVRAQLGDIKSGANDYEEIRDDVVAWVDTQPDYLQSAYKAVMKSGTAEEVIDLIDRFRKETGRVQAPAAPEKKAEPSDEAKKAARSMAPVSSKRSTVPQGDDPNDYEGAFKRFAGQSRA